MHPVPLRFRLKPGLIAMLAAVAGGIAIPASFALAQGSAAAAPPAQPTAGSLTVVAPRVLRGHAGPAWAQGAPIEVVSLSKTVNFADLDLTTSVGADEFKKRIMYAALDACDQLEAEYPSNRYVLVPATQNCPDTTATQALIVAKEIIAAARVSAK
jgi:UrcA family protein